jgi:hypothetical protein
VVQCCPRRPRPSTHQGGAVPVDLLMWDLVGLVCANWVQKYAPTVAESSEYGSATRARCAVLGSSCTGAGAEPGHGAGLWQVGLMRFDGPSLTAVSAARRRAIHQMLDGGAIFEDPVTLALLGLEPSEVDPALRTDQSSQRMRWFIAARIRFAEDRSRAAIRFGLSQVVVLGAGLDSFAYRLTSDPSVTVFKVDHPATQAWKRERLDAARVEATTTVVYAPVDFETDDAFGPDGPDASPGQAETCVGSGQGVPQHGRGGGW